MIQFAGKTEVGKKRSNNQDAYGALEKEGIFLLADGMGGHRGGAIASQEAIAQTLKSLSYYFKKDNSEKALQQAFQKTNAWLYSKGESDLELHGMGTTLVGGLFHPLPEVTLANVGDSRCYLVAPEGLWQLTIDHSLAEERFRAGLLTREALERERKKNILTRSVGYFPTLEVDCYHLSLRPRDALLFCSDGLVNELSSHRLWELLQQQWIQPLERTPLLGVPSLLEQTVTTLVEEANQVGGFDNITVLLVAWIPA